jgi:pyridoxine kinase
MRILAISSQVAYSPVGLTASVPALQAAGHEVLGIPTITLSNHPGHGKPAGFRTAPEDLARILDALDSLKVLPGVGAILTGYFASAEQVEAVAIVLARMKAANPALYVLVDPVIGDEGGLYVTQSVAEAIRGRLLPLATCITPNRFELEWISGATVADETSSIAAARTLGIAEVLATSIPSGAESLSTVLITPSGGDTVTAPRLTAVPNGTGDFLSGLYLAHRVTGGAEQSFAAAMKMLARAIARSAGTPVLDVAGALHGS